MADRSAEPGRKTPYSPDLRWRIVYQRIGMNLFYKEIAANLNVAASTVHRIYKRFENTGGVSPRRSKSRSQLRKLTTQEELHVIGIVLDNPSIYLSENMPYFRGDCGHFTDGESIYNLSSSQSTWNDKEENTTNSPTKMLHPPWSFYGSVFFVLT